MAHRRGCPGYRIREWECGRIRRRPEHAVGQSGSGRSHIPSETNQNAYWNPGAYAEPYGDPRSDAYRNSHADNANIPNDNRDTGRRRDSNGKSDSDFDTYRHKDSNSDPHIYSDEDANPDQHKHFHSHLDAHTDLYRHPNRNSHADTNVPAV